jgi:plastocyanin
MKAPYRRGRFSVALCIAAMAACATSASRAATDSDAQPAGGAGQPAVYRVEISEFAFKPNEIQVPAGARIVWVNRDEEPHIVVSTSGAFKSSPALDTNDSYATVLTKSGTYTYFCSIHPMMVGKIVVR